MNSRLVEILAEKRNEVEKLKEKGVPAAGDSAIPPIRDFKGALSMANRIGLIAEIKFASPSAGVIREKADPLNIGRLYERVGAVAISLITDKRFFKGDLNHLPLLKKNLSLPILRKDFIVDEVQVTESFLWGADAILLIVRLLSRQQLKDLMDVCHNLGMTALVEVHDRRDIEKAIECGARIIGINNRDLNSFEVNTGVTLELAPLVPKECIIVSESGIRDGGDIRRLKKTDVRAVLVGTSIMRSHDVAQKAKELVQAGRMEDGKGQNLRHHKSS